MKILFLNIYQKKVERGAETFVNELSKRLAVNHQVDIISSDRLAPQRWPFIWRAFLDANGIFIAWFTLKNLFAIWKKKYDIIIPLNGGWQPAFVRMVTWFYGGKMVISGQSGIGWDDRNNLWCFPDCFVALSTKAEKWANKAMPWIKTEFIPNGVDLKKFIPNSQSFASGLNKPIILCVGALIKQKRIDLVIKAVSKLKSVSLLVVGDGELKEALLKMGKQLLGKRFRLIKIPFDQMSKVYRCADVFTLVPESSEAFGVVFVEALSSNLPVVTINDEQRREIVGEAGLFVEATDIDIYAKALKKALVINWADKPRKQAQKFDWDKIAKEYEKLFRVILERNEAE